MLDEKKIIDLYHELSRRIYTYAYRFTGSRESAEDILHDVFVNLITYSQKKEIREDTIRAFLYRTAHNLAINHIKKEKFLEKVPLEESAHQSRGNTPHDDLEKKEIRQAMNRILNKADPETRSIFIMKKELHMKIPEIAAMIGISERTVKRRLRVILKNISEELNKSGYTAPVLFLLALLIILVVYYV